MNNRLFTQPVKEGPTTVFYTLRTTALSSQIMSYVIVIGLILVNTTKRLGVKDVPLHFSQSTVDVYVTEHSIPSWMFESLIL